MGAPQFRDHPLSTAQTLVEKLAICTVTFDTPRAEQDRWEAIAWLETTASRMGYSIVRKYDPDA
jgi:hypothetical protein